MGYFEQIIQQNVLDMQKKGLAVEVVLNDLKELSQSNLSEVKGLGVKTIDLLRQNGINSKEELKLIPLEKLKEIVKNPLTIKQLEIFLNS